MQEYKHHTLIREFVGKVESLSRGWSLSDDDEGDPWLSSKSPSLFL